LGRKGDEVGVVRNRNRSGKIQRPGPDSPGGPRVKRYCEVCQQEFWPRVVDVDRGWGRHCGSSCSGKAHRRAREFKCEECGGRFVSHHYRAACDGCLATKSAAAARRRKCASCGGSKDKSAMFCLECTKRARETDPRFLSVNQFAKRFGVPRRTLDARINRGELGDAFDHHSRRIDTEHAAADTSKWIRRTIVKGTRSASCVQCGDVIVGYASHLNRPGLRFCSQSCNAKYQATRRRLVDLERSCSECGEPFTVGRYKRGDRSRRTVCAGCLGARYTLELNGQRFSLRELSVASGIKESTIYNRIRRGRTVAQAITGRSHERDKP
jgi:hypothetical protein